MSEFKELGFSVNCRIRISENKLFLAGKIEKENKILNYSHVFAKGVNKCMYNF